MTRRLRLVSLLVALLALSAGQGAPVRTGSMARVIASSAWFRGDRTRPHVQRADVSPAPALQRPLTHIAPAHPPRADRLCDHALYQRPPPPFA